MLAPELEADAYRGAYSTLVLVRLPEACGRRAAMAQPLRMEHPGGYYHGSGMIT